MTWRWDDRDIALEDYALSTGWTEGFYEDWTPEGLMPGSSPGAGVQSQEEAGSAVLGFRRTPRSAPVSSCVVCDGLGCSHCPGVAA